MSIKFLNNREEIESLREIKQNCEKLKRRLEMIIQDVDELEGDMTKNLATLEKSA